MLVYSLDQIEKKLWHYRIYTTKWFYQHLKYHCLLLVQACTGGGCTVSNATSATTAESAPDGVAAPVVTSPSPSQLLVTWQEPEFPNGLYLACVIR